MAEKNKKINAYNKLARYCGLLTNPRRISLLLEVATKDNSVRNSLVEVEGLNKFAIGMNLKYLKKFGLIDGNLTTKNLEYCVNYEKLEEFKTLFDDFYNSMIAKMK